MCVLYTINKLIMGYYGYCGVEAWWACQKICDWKILFLFFSHLCNILTNVLLQFMLSDIQCFYALSFDSVYSATL